MKNILITGGAGYIGAHIIELLVKKNFNLNPPNLGGFFFALFVNKV